MTNPEHLSWNSSSSMHSFLSKYWKELVILGLVCLCVYLYKTNENMPPLFQGKASNTVRNSVYSNGMVPINPMNQANSMNAMNPYGNKPIISYDPVYGDMMMDARPVDVRREAVPKRPDPNAGRKQAPVQVQQQQQIQQQQIQQQEIAQEPMIQMVGNQIAPVQFGDAASYYSYKKQ